LAMETEKNYQIDNIDIKILNILKDNAKKPYTEVARMVHVSPGTVHVRMKKLEDMGVVTGTTLRVNYAQLGYDITCFLGIFLEKSSLYDEVVEQLKKVEEVVTIRYTTGNYNIFCKIYCRDTKHLRDVLHDKIQRIPGVESTETFISLEQSLDKHPDFNLGLG
jgi:Lrp/AsnC family transcriptional regulator, regulator for asnA, asnC and gidA